MIEIARILKPHGINGDLKIKLFSDNFNAFAEREFAYIKNGNDFLRTAYKAVRVDVPFIYVHFENVHTRDEAEAVAGTTLYIQRDDLEAPKEGEHYIVDLIGLKVVNETGAELGTLNDILQHGAADVYVVKGERNFMFPAIKRVIMSIDIEAGKMSVDADALAEVAVYDDV